jgi:hypothetical protein
MSTPPTFDCGVIHLSLMDSALIGDMLREAANAGDLVRVALDDGGLKLAVGRYSWTPPIGVLQ